MQYFVRVHAKQPLRAADTIYCVFRILQGIILYLHLPPNTSYLVLLISYLNIKPCFNITLIFHLPQIYCKISPGMVSYSCKGEVLKTAVFPSLQKKFL